MESNMIATWLPYITLGIIGFLAKLVYNNINRAIRDQNTNMNDMISNLNNTIVELNKTVAKLGERISHIEGKVL